MKKYLVFASFLITSYINAVNDDQNLDALKEWIATKRAVTVDERGGSLSVSGDVHVEYITASESINGIKNIGTGSLHPLIPENQFDIEFNFMLDYRNDLTWATTKLKFDNDAGIVTGTLGNTVLERAFFGFHLLQSDSTIADLEFGRRFLGYTFDSRIQFGSLMDGILLKINRSTQDYGDFYLFAAPFIVNEVLSHVSFVIETGILNIANTGFYAKYSLIDWQTRNYDNSLLKAQFASINSQFILGYRFKNTFFNAITILYASFLVNSAAKPNPILNNRRDNLAGYVGITMGELRKKRDWSFDLNFQFVQPQAIPPLDASGIGIYNPDNLILYVLNANQAVSNGNYYGFQVYFLYAIEDTITLAQSISFSRPLMHMTNKFDFQKYKLELIYAW